MSTTLEQPSTVSVTINCTFLLEPPESLPREYIRQGLVLVHAISIDSAPGNLSEGSQIRFKDLSPEHREFWSQVEQEILVFLGRIKPALPGWIVNHISCFVHTLDTPPRVITYRNLPPCIIPG